MGQQLSTPLTPTTTSNTNERKHPNMAAPQVFGQNTNVPVPFAPPERDESGFDNIDLKSVPQTMEHPYDGKTLVLDVKGPEQVQTNAYGVKTAIRADVLVADNGRKFTDQLLFNKAAVDLLPAYSGQQVTVAISTYKAHGKKHIDLIAPTEAQQALAIEALKGAEQPPF